ncbi:MAG TPA: hypothetical protein VG206_01440 [Terriglobia bacterium]|nr:hypothetical protein [Terriglobia bacterium]
MKMLLKLCLVLMMINAPARSQSAPCVAGDLLSYPGNACTLTSGAHTFTVTLGAPDPANTVPSNEVTITPDGLTLSFSGPFNASAKSFLRKSVPLQITPVPSRVELSLYPGSQVTGNGQIDATLGDAHVWQYATTEGLNETTGRNSLVDWYGWLSITAAANNGTANLGPAVQVTIIP